MTFFARRDVDRRVRRGFFVKQGLEAVQPGARPQAHVIQCRGDDIDVKALFQGKGQHRRAVVEVDGANRQGRFAQHDPVEGRFSDGTVGAKLSTAREAAGQGRCGVQFGDVQDEAVAIAFYQVPAVAGQLAGQVVEKPLGAKQMQILVPAQQDAQDAVEPAKVVHVGVGYENVADFQDVAGRQRGNVPQVEQQGAITVAKGYEQDRVLEGAVDQSRKEAGAHLPVQGRSLATCL